MDNAARRLDGLTSFQKILRRLTAAQELLNKERLFAQVAAI